MASNHDWKKGPQTDDTPDLKPFAECLGIGGAIHAVYGNHCDEISEKDMPLNSDSSPVILPDGETISSPWCGCPSLAIAGVHGIPGQPNGWKKRNRKEYYPGLQRICNKADAVVIHCNPKLPFQDFEGFDAERIFDIFNKGHARLLVHGHMHTKEVITILPNQKVIINSDNRVVVLIPYPMPSPDAMQPIPIVKPVADAQDPDKEIMKLMKSLRDIEKLAAREKAGDALDKLQLVKLNKKQELEQKLEALRGQICAKTQALSPEKSIDIAFNESFAESAHDDPAVVSWETHVDAEELPSQTELHEDRSKQIRKVRKQLREIENLLAEQQAGKELRKNQVWKIELKSEYEQQLHDLCSHDTSIEPPRAEVQRVVDAAVADSGQVQLPRKRWSRMQTSI